MKLLNPRNLLKIKAFKGMYARTKEAFTQLEEADLASLPFRASRQGREPRAIDDIYANSVQIEIGNHLRVS